MAGGGLLGLLIGGVGGVIDRIKRRRQEKPRQKTIEASTSPVTKKVVENPANQSSGRVETKADAQQTKPTEEDRHKSAWKNLERQKLFPSLHRGEDPSKKIIDI